MIRVSKSCQSASTTTVISVRMWISFRYMLPMRTMWLMWYFDGLVSHWLYWVWRTAGLHRESSEVPVSSCSHLHQYQAFIQCQCPQCKLTVTMPFHANTISRDGVLEDCPRQCQCQGIKTGRTLTTAQSLWMQAGHARQWSVSSSIGYRSKVDVLNRISLFVCVFVCLFVNITTFEWLNIGWWNLMGRCSVKKSRLSSNFRVIGPTQVPGPQCPKCGL